MIIILLSAHRMAPDRCAVSGKFRFQGRIYGRRHYRKHGIAQSLLTLHPFHSPQIWIECDLKIDFVHSMNVVVDWRPNFNWPFIHSLWACIRTKFYSYYRFISTRILLPCSQNPQNSNCMHVEEDIAPALRFYWQYCTTKAKNVDGNRCLIYVSVRWIESFLTHKSVWKNWCVPISIQKDN